MEPAHCRQATEPVQPSKGGFGFLAAVLDGLEANALLSRLQEYRHTGRPGYPVRAMWRAYAVKFVLKIRYSNQLLERLRGSERLRELCGFEDGVPSESAFSRFLSRLAGHSDLVEGCFRSVTSQLHRLVPKVKKRPGKQDQPLPPLGAVTAVDSTLFETYANPNRPVVSDSDARWGVKHSSRSKEGHTEWGFGYKLHMISDAIHGVPLSFTITPANANDSPQLPVLVRKVLDDYPWMKPRALTADRGYDSESNHRDLFDRGIIPVIHIRKPTADDGLYDGVYDAEGKPVCLGNVPMEYVRTDTETGHHLFRCRGGGCPLRKEGTKATTHCDTEMWETPENNLRVLGPLPRFTDRWSWLYKLRMSIERIFRSLKHSRALEGHCVRGLRKITLHATMSVLTYQATVLTYQATVLTRLRVEDEERMRTMTVKVA